MFANNIVLVGGNLEEVNNDQRLTHDGKGLKIIRNKIEYIEYGFGEKERVERMMIPMEISGHVIGEVENGVGIVR